MIIENSIITPDGTKLVSEHVHDYKTYIDSISFEEYMVDGGREYLRRGVNTVPYRETSLDIGTEHIVLRELKIWGTRGLCGSELLKKVSASEMDDNHIKAVLELDIAGHIRYVLECEVEFRYKQ